jgi:AcrR family transcriptional regulator
MHHLSGCVSHMDRAGGSAGQACENVPMGSVSESPQRLYRGISPMERRAQRRERLLEAGLELFGTQGYADSSIRAVCSAASLNSRYFYESFSGREDLLYHVYRGVVRDVAARVLEATALQSTIEGQAQAGLRASWTMVTEDPRKAKLIAVEVVGVSERLERLRRDNRHAFADILMRNARLITADSLELRMDPTLTSRSLMGAVIDLQVDWINGDVDASVDEIVEHFTKLFTAVAYATVRDPAALVH